MEGSEKLNIPNLITIGRFFFIPIYLFVFFSTHPYKIEIALLILLLAGLSDVLDGYLARKYKLITQLGIMLDPLADKLLMIAVVLAFVLTGHISWWAATLFLIRDIGMIVSSVFFHFQGKKTVPANLYGKLSTILFYIAFLLIMYRVPNAELFLWCVIALAFFASTIYLIAVRRVNRVTA